jgi:hypothetical protein
LVPAGVKGEDVAREHALEQPEDMVAVAQDDPALRGVARKRDEPELP